MYQGGDWSTRPKTVTHPTTNRAQRSVTSFIVRTTLPLRQTASRPVLCRNSRFHSDTDKLICLQFDVGSISYLTRPSLCFCRTFGVAHKLLMFHLETRNVGTRVNVTRPFLCSWRHLADKMRQLPVRNMISAPNFMEIWFAVSTLWLVYCCRKKWRHSGQYVLSNGLWSRR